MGRAHIQEMRDFFIRALIGAFILSVPAFLFVLGQGVVRVIEVYGVVFGTVIAVLTIPAFLCLALLLDSREAQDRKRQR